MWPLGHPPPVVTAEPDERDPRTRMEDEVAFLASTKGEEWCATMYRHLNRGGMTLDRALLVWQRMWARREAKPAKRRW